MYNWFTVNTNKLCPTGWHVPSDAEWTTLENYLIANGYNYDGTTTGNKIAKSMAATEYWSSSTIEGSVGNTDYPVFRNKSGFSGLPGGFRLYNGAFYDVGDNGFWWSSTEYSSTHTWNRYLHYNNTDLIQDYSDKNRGYSVRCIRD